MDLEYCGDQRSPGWNAAWKAARVLERKTASSRRFERDSNGANKTLILYQRFLTVAVRSFFQIANRDLARQ